MVNWWLNLMKCTNPKTPTMPRWLPLDLPSPRDRGGCAAPRRGFLWTTRCRPRRPRPGPTAHRSRGSAGSLDTWRAAGGWWLLRSVGWLRLVGWGWWVGWLMFANRILNQRHQIPQQIAGSVPSVKLQGSAISLWLIIVERYHRMSCGVWSAPNLDL